MFRPGLTSSSYRLTPSLTLLCSLIFLFANGLAAQNWQSVAEIQQNRFEHESVLLNDGRVLTMGGAEERRMPSINTCEMYDYRDNSVYATAPMLYPRQGFDAVLLDDGRVLAAGGAARKLENYVGLAVNTAEIYDPATETWTETGSMLFRREGFSMLKLQDGRVMVFGGVGGAATNEEWEILRVCEIYDPATETWSPAASMAQVRSAYSADLLDDGRVLVVGGYGNGGDWFQIYDPTADKWTVNERLLEARSGEHGSIRLPDERILRAGGWPGPSRISEIFDPMDGTWRVTLGDLQVARFANLMTLMPDGRVLTVGGHDSEGSSLNSVEIFDAQTESWSLGDALPQGTAHYSLIALPNGQSVLIGGVRLDKREIAAYNSSILLTQFPTLENSAKLAGKVWRDLDSDCVQDATDRPASETLLAIEPGSHLIMTDADGCFEALLPPADYSIQLVDQVVWHQTCPTEILELTVDKVGQVIEGIRLGAQPKTAASELQVSVAGTRARPGFEQRYFLRYQSRGTIDFSGELCCSYDPILDYSESIPAPDRVEEGRLIWEFNSVAPDVSDVIEVFFRIPADQTLIGQNICVDVRAKDSKRSDELLHERDESCIEITGSHDPNNLAVTPAGSGELGRVSDDVVELTYLARFQNNGNDTAFTVRLLDTLDRYHAPGTIRLGASSHPFKLNIHNGRILEFVFSDIKLPFAAQGLQASQGFVKYYVSRQAELPEATTLDNQVAIYFDFNEPIFTNTVFTTFDNALTSVQTPIAAQLELDVYPNPARQSTNIALNSNSQITSLQIVDVLGRTVRQHNVRPGTQREEVNVETLPAGSYQIIARDTQGTALAGQSLQVEP